MIYHLPRKFELISLILKFPFFAILRTFSPFTREIYVEMTNKIHCFISNFMPYKMIYHLPPKFKFFPGKLAFCKKAVERVNSEKNILNSSVECVEWFFLEKVICMYIIRSASMSWLTWCTLFLIWTHISRVIDENVRKMAKNGDLETRIYGSKNILCCRA